MARERMPRRGDIVAGKYLVGGLLGSGGTSKVFAVTHVHTHRRMALKYMLPAWAGHTEVTERFLREARAIASIDHSNIVKVYDVGRDGESVYMVIERLEGRSLADVVGRGALDPAKAVRLILPAIRAVASAHRHEIVHRDLKPDNLFLCDDPEGGEPIIKVLDFGICQVSFDGQEKSDIRTSGPRPRLTQPGHLLGTPEFMSPEQVAGRIDIDLRCDIYALGVVLYEALTGQLPFDGEDVTEIIGQIARGKPRPIRRLRPEVPRGLERVVMRALAKQPEDRWQDADAFADALLPFATPPKRTRAVASAPGRRARRVAPVVAGAVSLVAAAVVVTWSFAPDSPLWGGETAGAPAASGAAHDIEADPVTRAPGASKQPAKRPASGSPPAATEAPETAVETPGSSATVARVRPAPMPEAPERATNRLDAHELRAEAASKQHDRRLETRGPTGAGVTPSARGPDRPPSAARPSRSPTSGSRRRAAASAKSRRPRKGDARGRRSERRRRRQGKPSPDHRNLAIEHPGQRRLPAAATGRARAASSNTPSAESARTRTATVTKREPVASSKVGGAAAVIPPNPGPLPKPRDRWVHFTRLAVSGPLSAFVVRAGLLRARAEIRACFKAAPHQGSRPVEVTLGLNPGGHVDRVIVKGAKRIALGQCVRRSLFGVATYQKPPSAVTARFRVEYR